MANQGKNKIIKSYLQDLDTASVLLAKCFPKAVEVLSAMKGKKKKYFEESLGLVKLSFLFLLALINL